MSTETHTVHPSAFYVQIFNMGRTRIGAHPNSDARVLFGYACGRESSVSANFSSMTMPT
jgi:hypothetical protein